MQFIVGSDILVGCACVAEAFDLKSQVQFGVFGCEARNEGGEKSPPGGGLVFRALAIKSGGRVETQLDGGV